MTTPCAAILIVDDEAPNRKLLETLLRPEGHVTRTAANGEEALASVAREPPDLILLDVMMPGMDGFQVARALKANPGTAHIPIIMVTASVGRDARLAGLNAGAEDFLNKPVDRGELWLRVRNLLRLKSLSDFQKNHNEILEQQVQQRTVELQNYRTAMDATVDTILMVNRSTMRIVHANVAAASMLGYTVAELLRLSPVQLGAGTLEELATEYDAVVAGKNSEELTEVRLRRKDGFELQVEVRRHAHRSGQDWIIVAIARDITERKKAEARIKRLNRVYAVLSGINTLIVRVRDRDELFKSACRIAIEDGGFLLAWVAVVDRTAMMLSPVASAGTTQDPLALINQRFALGIDAPLGNTFSARAIREKRIVISNDVRHDPLVLFKEEHARRGSRSMAMLPLQVAGEVAGILALYSSEVGFFDDEELKLLAELAGDIAFAIDNIGRQERFDYLAYYDALTGLANRRLFLERVAQHIRGTESGGHRLAVFLIDLERFKSINDSLGQAAGDALLRQVADWLTQDCGDASLVARIGADHFALVLPEVKDIGGVARLIERSLATFLEHPFRLEDAVFRVSAKIGAALYPEDGANADVLLKNAEAALKNAKASGDKFLFYTQTMTEKVAAKLTLENQLRRAFDNSEFVLHYQPKVSLATGRLTGVEALIRWNDPQTGLVPPGRFIPVLEETGLMHEVGRWALREATTAYLRWQTAGLPAVRVAVNVSPMQLRNRGFVDEIVHLLGVDARAAAGLELEITESLIMEDAKHSIASLEAIRATGVTIAIDDFGTGFSSLSYLAKLPVDTLKIDRSFVTDMMAGPDGLALVSTIIDLAHSLRLKVVAEGVEAEEQSRLLRLLKCDEMQGFLFSKPLPADQFEAQFLLHPKAADGAESLTSRGARQRTAA